jgi:hypothetical protein
LSDFVAPEPNHQLNSAAHLQVPAAVSGRFGVAGQKDYYAFAAKRGNRVLVRGQSRSIGSGCELEIVMLDARGKKVPEFKPPTDAKKAAAADATTPPAFVDEPALDVEIPADGEYRIVARDLGNGGGTGMVYRLVVERGPDFSLAAGAEKVDVPAGGSARVKVSCLRRGFKGRIRLSLGDNPGWEAGEAFIEPGKSEGEIEVKAVDQRVDKPAMNLRVVGTAMIDGVEKKCAASTAAAVQKVYPRMRFVPWEVDGLIGVGRVEKN